MTESSTPTAELQAILPDEMSPYKLADIASNLKGSLVRPQMVYQYCNKGFIKASKNSLGKWSVKAEDAAEWLEKYLKKNS